MNFFFSRGCFRSSFGPPRLCRGLIRSHTHRNTQNGRLHAFQLFLSEKTKIGLRPAPFLPFCRISGSADANRSGREPAASCAGLFTLRCSSHTERDRADGRGLNSFLFSVLQADGVRPNPRIRVFLKFFEKQPKMNFFFVN